MLSTIHSATLIGLQAVPVTVEVDASQGLPGEVIVGLPDTVVRESRNRIRHAIRNSGMKYPIKAYTINLAPADLRKEGSFFDLPIAMGILHNTKQLEARNDTLYVGELRLNGDIQSIRGILSICELAKEQGFKRIVLPADNAPHAQLIKGIELIPIRCLQDLRDIESGQLLPQIPPIERGPSESQDLDFCDVKGQWAAKRLCEIAAVGQHNILLIGSPGSGKTMLLKRLPTILPELTLDEAIERYKIHSLFDAHPPKTLDFNRPLRAPHHSISYAGLAGGGSNPKPGEISLAHLGILFLDEFPEFSRNAIEVLRQPMEDQKVTLTRANFSISYPADFMLIAAMNPCPCGYAQDPHVTCTCPASAVKKYWRKISGPILDRIDMVMTIPKLSHSDIHQDDSRYDIYSTHRMKARIEEARHRQKQRQKLTLNANLSTKQIEYFCGIPDASKQLLGKAVDQGLLSGRSYHKVLKIARSIADLEGDTHIESEHIVEAMHYRKQLIVD